MIVEEPAQVDGRPRRRVWPPVYFLLALAAMVALHFFAPLVTLLRPPASYAGVLLAGAGLRTVLGAANLFTRHRTTLKPFEHSTALVTEGAYRLSRNPMYLGMILLLLGVAVLLGTLAPFLPIPPLAWILHRRFVRPEEAILAKRFGEEYAAYCNKVRRWL